ncbi:hypothetical protein [Brevibacillus laterosporus]|uniref:hypothetical protein n=1 Tax=Brevibacillus laterosporus TaxID=1465 RepID=UPI000E6BAE64|nr:hypothetical protein [Brevibacillus laterosporus]AYB39708.1 hypothetical protein D5F52_16315 [Brevibacillus laterosporus]MBM7109135.1 hypothetical protein [Brevibacillus laterosporus]
MEEINQTPNFIKNRIDLKIQTLTLFNSAIETMKSEGIAGISLGSDTNVLIITNFGIVSGDIKQIRVQENSDESEKPGQIVFKMLIETLVKSRNTFLSKEEDLIGHENVRAINDSSFVILENVTVTPFSNPNMKTHLESMILFSDQISGISYGASKVE